VAGRTVTVPETDFEFDLTGAAPKFTPIYRPISPVDIGPEQDVFVDSQQVTLSSKTPGVDLRYTLDGTDPTPQSTLYTGPFTITGKTTVKARAYRPGVTVNPPQMSGTDATAVSLAVFTKESLTPAATPPHPMTGLDTGYLESSWQQLFLGTDDVAPKANGTTAQLFDTSLIPADNAPIRDAATPRTRPYELTYSGFLNVPADGVYTLYAPHEYVWHATDAGYDLRVWLGNKYGVGPFTGRVVGTNEWYPSTRIHAFGTWSIALQKGLQPFRVEFVDYRTNAAKLLNRPGIKDYIWSGVTPDLEISGPGIDKEPIPADWLMRPYRKG